MKQNRPEQQKKPTEAPAPGKPVTMRVEDWPAYRVEHNLVLVSLDWSGNGPLQVQVAVKKDERS